jgi:uncharacterized protein (DUF1697 family)
MERLRTIFAALPGTPLGDVETFIASGNVVFTTRARDDKALAALERRIARHLHAALGYEVATFVRAVDALAALAQATPFAGVGEGHTLSVGFLHAPPPPDRVARLVALGGEGNTLAVHGREVWWWSLGRTSESGLDGGKLERALGVPMTMRNVTTVRRLAAKYGGA